MKILLHNMRSFLVDADRVGAGSQIQKVWVKNVREKSKTLLKNSLITRTSVNSGGEVTLAKGSSNEVFISQRIDDDLVGIKKARHELLGWLMAEEPRRTVISVVGMGGSGKNTLVANTFNEQSVKRNFEFCTWITVSQQYAIEELLRSIVKDIYNQTTREVLMQEINIAFPEGMRRSRVVVTTRREDVVPCQSGFLSHVHRIQPLRMNDAWDLFCKKAFPNGLGRCSSHLDESLARNLVKKCEGLPLAISALGGLMSSKKSITERKRVHDNMAWELSNNPLLEIMKTISMLSYHDLPFQLEQGFLYFSLFPEDYEIVRKRIMRLWTAEGFLESIKDVQPEAVSESYLMELISRSLVQVTLRNEFGRPRKFKMHDLIRDFALSIAKEESFLAECNGDKGVEEEEIHCYLVRVKDEEITTANDLGNAPINEEPIEFGDLFNLRYLNMSRTQVEKLPKTIGKRFNLQSLLLKFSKIKELPNEVEKLQNLRHLSAFYLAKSELRGVMEDFQCMEVPPNICMIKSLQVLYHVRVTNDLLIKFKEMEQLRRIGLDGLTEADEEHLCISIHRMQHLHYLWLTSLPQGALKLDVLPSAPPYLEKLYLDGKLGKVPHWFNTLLNLKLLSLQDSQLRED
ncbi:hypothetical protein F3Y22_tig00000340pilonHSYRG00481 [Hibiscus syriacus]|uniref:NB-ARC domain-containing protein n=1 Tax=Hibiscus syriacus TaxID=106335 RepID=A0A6A3D6C7_HIBSY|nr:hypothetical protein F3Y22_tig00000340pilonHSYRG00481 [Hibiscus syriacus]